MPDQGSKTFCFFFCTTGIYSSHSNCYFFSTHCRPQHVQFSGKDISRLLFVYRVGWQSIIFATPLR